MMQLRTVRGAVPEGEDSASGDSTSLHELRRSTWGLFVAGAYLTLLGGLRLREVLGLPPDMQPAPGFPSWLLEYLAALCWLMLSTGVLLVVSGTAARKAHVASRWLTLGGAVGAAIITLMHAWFLYFHERAFSYGGLVWGILHLVTLTREDTTATPAGIVGYRMGQTIGLVLWSAGVLYLFVLRAWVNKIVSDLQRQSRRR